MKRSQIVFTNYPYHKFTLKYTLDSLKRLGAENIEFVACEPHFYFDDVQSNEAAVVKGMLRERGLNMVCLTAPCNEYPINLASRNPVTRKRSVDFIVKAIEYANYFEAPAVQFVAGEALLEEEKSDALQRAKDALFYLAGIAEGYGVKLLNPYHDSKLTNVLGSAAEVRALHEELGKDAFLGMTDTVYMQRLGETVEDVTAAFGKDLCLVHFADCKDSTMHLAPGEGTLDLESVLAALDAAGYAGWLSLNMRGSRDPYLYEEEPETCMGVGGRWLAERLENA